MNNVLPDPTQQGVCVFVAAAPAIDMEVLEESNREGDTQGEGKKQERPNPEAATGGGGAQAAAEEETPAAHAHAPKRNVRTPAVVPKRATRASTGAPIALTAKGSLYKANKDTGERGKERERGRRRGCDRVWGV